MNLKEVKHYHSNGKLCSHYFIDEQKRKQGKYICYYVDGIISDETNFKDDERHGKYISYKLDGTINHIIYFWHGDLVTKTEFLRKKYDEAMKCN